MSKIVIKKDELELPVSLPHGAKTAVAKRLKVCRKTVERIMKKGKSDPRYGIVLETARQWYGKRKES